MKSRDNGNTPEDSDEADGQNPAGQDRADRPRRSVLRGAGAMAASIPVMSVILSAGSARKAWAQATTTATTTTTTTTTTTSAPTTLTFTTTQAPTTSAPTTLALTTTQAPTTSAPTTLALTTTPALTNTTTTFSTTTTLPPLPTDPVTTAPIGGGTDTPEPAAVALMGTGLAALLASRRRVREAVANALQRLTAWDR